MQTTTDAGFAGALVEALAERRDRDPAAVAIEPLDGGDPWTFEGLLDEAAAVHGLLHQTGVAPGARVLVQTEKSPRAAALYLGILAAGAVHVPLNPAYTDEEREHFLDDAEPALLVCAPDRVPSGGRVPRVLTLDGAGAGTLADAVAGAPRIPDPVPRSAADPAAILYTSGTTGRSKGAVLTHGNLAHGARVLVDAWGWREDDVLIHALPIFHVHGLFVALHCAWLGGGRVLWLGRFDAGRVLEALPRATVLMGVPTFYTRLLADPALDRARCARMRLFVCGSAPLTEATFEAFAARTGHRILERYGMSETLMNTSNPLDGDRVPGTVGYPLPGTEVRVRDEEDRDVPDGEVGQLHVRGANVFSGYRNLPDKTRSEFTADGFFRTGDLGTRAPDGRIAIVGRAKDLIISGGYNVYPREVERLLDEQESVVESAVIGVPHPDLGEAVVAVVVAQAGRTSQAQVLEGLSGRLARFKQPRRVVFEDRLPRNAMGKVQKNLLRDRHWHLFGAGT